MVPFREGDGGSDTFRPQVLVCSRLLFINYLSTPGPIFKLLSILDNHSCPLEAAILIAVPLNVKTLGSGYTDPGTRMRLRFENATISLHFRLLSTRNRWRRLRKPNLRTKNQLKMLPRADARSHF